MTDAWYPDHENNPCVHCDNGRPSRCPVVQKTKAVAALDKWWAELSRKGDPQRVYNLTEKAFVAGFLAGANGDAND